MCSTSQKQQETNQRLKKNIERVFGPSSRPIEIKLHNKKLIVTGKRLSWKEDVQVCGLLHQEGMYWLNYQCVSHGEESVCTFTWDEGPA